MVSLFTRATRVLIIRPALFFPGAPGDLTLDRDKPLTFENTILENRDNVMHEPSSYFVGGQNFKRIWNLWYLQDAKRHLGGNKTSINPM